MTRACGAFGLLLAMVVGAGWHGGGRPAGDNQQSDQYTIRTTSRLVLLDVSVKNPAGALVGGLAKNNFEVRENGRPQQITHFAHADIPVTVGLVVDESGSMRSKQALVITAALGFIGASNPEDETFVINFNEKARRGLPDIRMFSDNVEQLRAALWQGVPEGRTALYDAIEMAVSQLDFGRRDKKTLIIVSDGGDNVSSHTLDELMRDILKSAATIYTIGVFDEDDPDKNPRVLKRIAEVSGGEAFFPQKLDEIVPICRAIAKDIRARYTIGYVPVDEGKPERQIKVTAWSGSGQKLRVKTRTRYLFTPEAAEAGAR